uniref:Uncharacterized protein n=1 Tax=Aegilops tauschii subsp. strangulata TaxID=200361 RepID=A0A453F9N7_AEGTS
KDPWIPRNFTRRVITPRRGSILEKVADLINPITGSWDEQLITETFWEEDAKFILSIPLFEDTEDFPACHPDPKGLFSVKIGLFFRHQNQGSSKWGRCITLF